jgi:hypothetical protein
MMDTLIREHAWFLAFWGVIVLLGTIEYLFPQSPGNADRARRWPTNFGLGDTQRPDCFIGACVERGIGAVVRRS